MSIWRPLGFTLFSSLVLACGGDKVTVIGSGSVGSGGAEPSSVSAGGNGAGAGGQQSTATAGVGGGEPITPCEPGALAAGDHSFTLPHDGAMRRYNLHIPPAFDGSKPLPLLLNFHGFGSDPEGQAAFSGMNAAADKEGFAVLLPAGIDNSWNGGSVCCGTAAQQNIDDVGFARALVKDAAAKACIDTKRVYSTGMSNGGFMSHRLACEASDLVAAVAPVDGLLGIPPESCLPKRPVPMIHFYGTADQLVPYEYAKLTNEFWVDRYQCSDKEGKVTFENGKAKCLTHGGCEGGVTVTFCTVDGMGHCWPGQTFCPPSLGQANTDISANAEMLKLFKQHALP